MNYQILAHSFLGSTPKKGENYTIIGAGIAGLIMGYHLKKAGISFKIVEQSKRAGGLLGSHSSHFGLAEQAANGFIWCPEIAEVCADLGLKIIGPKPSAKARYLVRNGQLRQFPLKFWETLALLGNVILPHRKEIKTIDDFGRTYFGKAFTNQILEPAFAGIYGAPIQQLSFSGALSPLAKIMNGSRHLPLALLKNKFQQSKNAKNQAEKRRGTHGFENGMQSLVSTLATHLKEHLHFETNGLSWKDSDEQLILCTPAHITSQFFDDDLKDLLAQIKYTPIITSTFVFEKSAVQGFKEGFGCLIPRSEGLQILGVLFNSCIFPNRVESEDWISLTCIMRDDDPDLAHLKMLDVDIKNRIVNELDRLFGLEKQPLDYQIFRWEKGIPLYSPEMYQSLFQIKSILEDKYPNRAIFGNYTGEISIRGMFQSAAKLNF